MSKEFHQSVRRCNRIGPALLDGPYCIMPPIKVDRFGWLGPVLKIIEQPVGKKALSCSVFVDTTINREKNFLQPLVRYAEWDRPYEYKIKRLRKWPKVTIVHHLLREDEQKEIDHYLRKLDQSLSEVVFLTAGLITNRTEPNGCYPDEEIEITRKSLKIERSNFCQYIELILGEQPGLNIKIEQVVQPIMSYIKHLCDGDEELNYRECYEHNLEKEDLRRGEWFYRPPSQ